MLVEASAALVTASVADGAGAFGLRILFAGAFGLFAGVFTGVRDGALPFPSVDSAGGSLSPRRSVDSEGSVFTVTSAGMDTSLALVLSRRPVFLSGLGILGLGASWSSILTVTTGVTRSVESGLMSMSEIGRPPTLGGWKTLRDNSSASLPPCSARSVLCVPSVLCGGRGVPCEECVPGELPV